MDEMDVIGKMMDDEAQRVSGFMSFLITDEALNTLDEESIEALRARNLMRLALAETWVEAMKKQFEKKFDPKLWSQYENLKKSMLVSEK